MKPIEIIDGKKRCPRCDRIIPVSGFHLNKITPSGLASWCKRCAAENRRQWAAKNKERIKSTNKRWISENIDAFREWRRRYQRKAYRQGHNNITRKFRNAIKRGLKYGKHNQSWSQLVPYSVDELKERLISTIPAGYSFSDYVSGCLELDHIIPVSAFNFTDIHHLDFHKCWALENLRLVPARINRAKSNRLIKPHQPSLPLSVPVGVVQ